MRYSQPWIPGFLSGFFSFLVFLSIALPIGAEAANGLPTRAEATKPDVLLQELSQKAKSPGFADLVISKTRSLDKLADSVAVISELIPLSNNPGELRKLRVELASLHEVLGNYKEAAIFWEAAVAADPGSGETAWLLSAAACRLKFGDAETAAALAKAVLLTATDPGAIALATLIEAHSLAQSGNFSAALVRSKEAVALDFPPLQAAALALARDASSGTAREAYTKQLHDNYSGRPEAQDGFVMVSPLLQLSMELITESTQTNTDLAQKPNDNLLKVPVNDNQANIGDAFPLYYQLGAFRESANAELLIAKLERHGFQAKTFRRDSKSGQLYLVYVDAGPNASRMMVALKDAGFETWPLFSEP